MKTYLTIGIADDDIYWRSTIINHLHKNKNNHVLFTSINGYDLLKQAIKFTPQLLIIDSHMPLLCGIEAAIVLKPQFPQTKIICLSMVYQKNISKQLFDNGINGYTTKDCELIGLIDAIKNVLLGNQYYKNNNSPDEEIKRIKQEVDGIESYNLSPTHIETLKLISKGLTSKIICEKLNEDIRTTESRVNKLKSIFDVENVQQLMFKATYLGVIPPRQINKSFKQIKNQ